MAHLVKAKKAENIPVLSGRLVFIRIENTRSVSCESQFDRCFGKKNVQKFFAVKMSSFSTKQLKSSKNVIKTQKENMQIFTAEVMVLKHMVSK